MGGEGAKVWTIGHSNHPVESFLRLLQAAGITAVADVRTTPFSRHNTQFNRPDLRAALRRNGIEYSFLGDQLGGRPGGAGHYARHVADYERMAREPSFAAGLDRVLSGARRFRIALMCSEQDPLDCHRCLLVGRALDARGAAVAHIMADGTVLPHHAIEARLLRGIGGDGADLFLSPSERLASAYRARSRKVAYAEPDATALPADVR